MVDELVQVGGPLTEDEWWFGENGPAGFSFSDAAVDWIDQVANGETPTAQP